MCHPQRIGQFQRLLEFALVAFRIRWLDLPPRLNQGVVVHNAVHCFSTHTGDTVSGKKKKRRERVSSVEHKKQNTQEHTRTVLPLTCRRPESAPRRFCLLWWRVFGCLLEPKGPYWNTPYLAKKVDLSLSPNRHLPAKTCLKVAVAATTTMRVSKTRVNNNSNAKNNSNSNTTNNRPLPFP